MNRFAPLLLATSLGLMAACHSGMSNRDYLYENVASWNSMVNTVQLWTEGARGEAFHAALQDGKSLEQFRFGLGNAHKEATDRLTHIELLTHGKDADALHQDLRDSVQSTADMFAVMQKIAALPDGYSEEQVTPLLQALDEATTKMDTDMQALSDAQDAFAKANRIQLQTTG
ncbi:hypothetical protein [Stenotrophomonas sp. YAU14D1_LEIMI4_1]|uniref:hypothetical protein n=1 Tax=Stenotrophomonas sp. YAU14D1_LEIMI4_1 TaxID=2072407 RepID=UPI000D5401C1|nr:hypothetical protein [Stenotrophomonas sp. YAU14D1_LEIMI4_1]AWH24729.1 hypothetical protein C1932_06190 [Stenotrophomonas sp. YAU14D1_LEIMI4_1]